MVLDLIRGLVRPVATLGVLGTLCAIIIRLTWGLVVPVLPEAVFVALLASFTTTVGLIVAFWFGNRTRQDRNGT